jgi:hypothetical protein
LKEVQEKRLELMVRKVDEILGKCKVIEEEVFPDVSKIADDDDEIEILKGKREILKEMKR